jgi:Pectinacetylesterase
MKLSTVKRGARACLGSARAGASMMAACMALWAPLPVQAGYYQWDAVTLPLASGAACGNGTPYTFFVNRAWRAKDTVMVFEGGGACWDQASCEGLGLLAASNPDGVGRDYMRSSTNAAFGLVTPFISRLNVLERVRTQGWNMVYLPYCTGDVHTGSQRRSYDDARPEFPRVQHHHGLANVRAASAWVRDSFRTRHLLVTGFSAGAVGATATWPVVRGTLAPSGHATLLADSGPLFPAPLGADPEVYPSTPLHTRIREAWGLDAPEGIVPTVLAALPGFRPDDLGSVSAALALQYPQDRFGYMSFQADATFAAFSYAGFDPALAAAAAVADDAARRARLLASWERDLEQWKQALAPHANVSWHLPFFRDFAGSHCLTLVDFSGTGIEEVDLGDIKPFVNNTIDRGPTMRNTETDRLSDLTRPLGDGLRRLLDLLKLFGIAS